ncbi:MAG TPA: rhomboid family intramembrane serine protease [Dongiaceae bacterium]|nr:rhomboid family intramembrane serine protease [Dongiaceae bacterium]
MRLIGRLDNELSASAFGDYLFAQGIENQIEFEKGDGWGLWIRDEDKLERAAALLVEFRQDPARPQYRAQAKAAAGLRAQQAKNEAAYQKRLRTRRLLFQPLTGYGFGVVTYGLIGISVVVCILSNFGHDTQSISGFFITSTMADQGQMVYAAGLPEVRHGQVWRLLTPIFIHFGPLHILFNMLWLRDLGGLIEARQGPWHLGLLVLVLAVFPNLAQYYMHGPMFGGMSGVVYGLLGYIWIRGKLDPGSGLYLHPTTVWMMIIWFVLCVAGLFGAIANTVHAVGLGLGMAWGFLSGLRHR